MAKPKPMPPSAAQIEADVRASLEALGMSTALAEDTDDSVFNFYAAYCLEHHRFPSQVECGKALGMDQSRVSMSCARLVEAGRMSKVGAKGRRPGYLPLVAKGAR